VTEAAAPRLVLPTIARAILVAIAASVVLLPIARAYLLPARLGDLLDAIFIPFCHRIPERTLTIAGVAMPVCSRCFGLFTGAAIGALVTFPRLSLRRWRFVAAFALAPMLADVITQDAGLHAVSHPLRFATGFLFGYALGATTLTFFRDLA
jgi:uncharacterized membrane protein